MYSNSMTEARPSDTGRRAGSAITLAVVLSAARDLMVLLQSCFETSGAEMPRCAQDAREDVSALDIFTFSEGRTPGTGFPSCSVAGVFAGPAAARR